MEVLQGWFRADSTPLYLFSSPPPSPKRMRGASQSKEHAIQLVGKQNKSHLPCQSSFSADPPVLHHWIPEPRCPHSDARRRWRQSYVYISVYISWERKASRRGISAAAAAGLAEILCWLAQSNGEGGKKGEGVAHASSPSSSSSWFPWW